MRDLRSDRPGATPDWGLGADQTAALYRSLVDDAFDFMVAVRADFSVAFVSAGIEPHLGHPADHYVGAHVVDHLHPDDLERALLHLQGWQGGAAQGGTTVFRIRHADGDYRSFDVTSARVSDGVDDYLTVYCRPVDYQQATDEVMAQLIGGGSRADALRPVLDCFSWQLNRTSIAISWYERGVGHLHVTTGDLPPELAGAVERPGKAWAAARDRHEPVLDLDRSLLDDRLLDLADQHDCGAYWVVPVPDAGSPFPALVTVWAGPTNPRPDGHAFGMEIAHKYIELILLWHYQVGALRRDAMHDPLTGLANRSALFDVLEAGSTHGALLFCDLDHFKPVNDQYGHAAGDEVLRQIAHRMRGAVRAGDLVARTGGDEFVVLAPGATLEQAAALAQRIRNAVLRPTELADGTRVHVGVTIGVAHADHALTEQTLAGADEALMAAKATARGTVRWRPGDMPPGPLPRYAEGASTE